MHLLTKEFLKQKVEEKTKTKTSHKKKDDLFAKISIPTASQGR